MIIKKKITLVFICMIKNMVCDVFLNFFKNN
jgi:hypothetical protein